MNTAVLSLLVSNHFGVLTRVTNLFSQRGFNIDTLAVGVTENPGFSRITITTRGDFHIINQIKLQLAKLEDVKIVEEIPEETLFMREVMMMKVMVKQEQCSELTKEVEAYHGVMHCVEACCYIITFTDTPAMMDTIVANFRKYGIKEVSRTGGVALQLASKTIY